MFSMRTIPALIVGAVLAATSLGVVAEMPPGFWSTPTIQGYGKMHYLPQGAYQPKPDQTYKLVFAITQPAKSPGEVNDGLDHVARAVNLYVAAGVPLNHLKFVVIAEGHSVPLALNDQQYRKAYGVPNPNLILIDELRKAGVQIAVCGQAVALSDISYDWIDPRVTLALSALTTISTLEHQGYGLMPL
jgi:intracellular sulfur oxidation DsrE/DsrF family protein